VQTELTRRWDLRVPIVLAPMARVGGGELARAVSAAGGLGMIGIGSATATDWIGAQAALARRDGHRFGVGLMAWALEDRPELLDAALEERPFAVSISFGDPAPHAERVHAAGAVLVSQVSDRDTALRAVDAGVDVLVAQGTEAGGHTGAVGTLPLLDVVLRVGDRSGLPVLAAGGIASGRALAGVLAMGAAGGWVGTRFAASAQALGTDAAKRRIVAAGEADTVHTRVFDLAQGIPWPRRYPGRALRNAFTDRWHGREDDLAADRSGPAADLAAAAGRDDYDTMYVYAGQASGLVDAVEDAGELVTRMAREAEEHLRRAATLA
jgi:nitronate monooxygenase